MANSKKRKKQPKNPTKVEAAEIKQKPKVKTEVRSVSDAENGETSVKNLLIIIGIIVLLVVALILAGLFVSSLTNQGSSTTDSSSTESVAGSEEVSSSTESTETVSSEVSSSVESTASAETSSTTSSTSSEDTAGTTDTTGEGSVNGDGISYDMPTEFSYAAVRSEGVAHQARKAIRDYLDVTGNSLSLAQRLFMEVTLQNSHNPVYMEIGEGRTFTLGEMDSAFASASTLSSYQISAWQNQVNAAHYTGII